MHGQTTDLIKNLKIIALKRCEERILLASNKKHASKVSHTVLAPQGFSSALKWQHGL